LLPALQVQHTFSSFLLSRKNQLNVNLNPKEIDMKISTFNILLHFILGVAGAQFLICFIKHQYELASLFAQLVIMMQLFRIMQSEQRIR